ncbi:MAG: putative nucleic acid-binding Zn-ribbon protein [Planctomycetota bacterium]|jgi:predicted  nucleic acid-binding Zn-ribbon protein
MSPIGKIFIVINLALAAAFLGWASNVVATSQDWKTKHEVAVDKLDSDTANLNGELSDLRTELSAVRDDKKSATDSLSAEKNRADRAERERDDQITENQQMRGDLTKLQSSMDAYNSHLSSVDTRLAQATEAQRDADREASDARQEQKDAEHGQSNAEESARQSEMKVDDLRDRLAAATKLTSDLDAQLTALVDYTGVAISDVLAQQDIEGAVVSAKMDVAPGLVSINRGSEDGVKLGTTFDVFNGRTYKGRVRVQIVHGTWSSAILIRKGAEGEAISAGDSVATRL